MKESQFKKAHRGMAPPPSLTVSCVSNQD